jgi:Protein of unknown function (DUF2934)
VAQNQGETAESGSLGDREIQRGEALRGDAPAPNENDLDAGEAIRARAYELYLQRGDGGTGDEMNDWLEAEREYRERRGISDTGETREQAGM